MKKKLIILILVIGAFLRFFDLANVAQFEFDDQYNSYLVYNLIKNKDFSLIGQEGSFGGIYWGPWHYLYLTPFYFLTNLHPIGGYIAHSILGLISIFSYYFVGKRLFNQNVGILAAFLRSISFISIVNDRTISPPYPAEIVALWFIYFLVRFYQKEKLAIPALAFLTGMMTSTHVILFPLIIVWLILFFIKRPQVNLKLIGVSLLMIFIPIAPLLIFEIRHKFIHILGFLKTLVGMENGVPIDLLSKMLYVISYNTLNFYKFFDSWFLPSWLGVFLFLLILFFLYKEKNAGYHKILFPLLFLAIVSYYIIYPRHTPEYYFMALFPVILLYSSYLFFKIWNFSLGKIFCAIFLLVVTYSNLNQWYHIHVSPNKFALAQKEWAVKTIVDHQMGKGDFSISYFTEYGRHYGFQYFFTYYGLEPKREIKPPIYSIVMPKSQVAEKDLSASNGDIGLIFPEDEPEQGQ